MRKIAFMLLWLYVFTLPWDYLLEFGEPIGSAGRVAGLLVLAACMVLVATGSRMRRLQTFHISAVGYLGIVTLSLFWTADPQESLRAVRTYIQAMMIVWLLWELGVNRRDLFHLAAAYVAGAYVGVVSVFHSFSLATVAAGAKEARFSADRWNANDIALALALAIPLALYVAGKRAHSTTTWLAYGYLIVGPLAIVLTSSRAGFVVMAIAFFGLPLFLRRQTAAAKLVMLIMLICAAFLTWNYAPAQSWDRLSSVFTSFHSGDLNGREQIWQSALHAFNRNYFVGVGAGAFQAGLGSYFAAHNTFLAVLVEQGLLGFSVFAIILGCTIYSTMRLTGDERKMCVLLLLCWAVGAFTLGWAMNRITWFVLGIVVAYANSFSDRYVRDGGLQWPHLGEPSLRRSTLRDNSVATI